MYLDSAYIAKYYVNESDSTAVRKQIREAPSVCSSAIALTEVACLFNRHVRENSFSHAQGMELMELFRSHVDAGLWNLVPISDNLLRTTATLIHAWVGGVNVRAAHAVHIATALHVGENAIWTNDRLLLAAATHAGLRGLSVPD